MKWWFKNGIERETCFAVEYKDTKTDLARAFYPDFIVCFTDDSVGIYDTKSGITAEIDETKAKSNSLHSYIKSQSSKRMIKGGIIQATQSGLFVFENF